MSYQPVLKVFSITYDLKQPGRDYTGLYEAIRQAGPWWHFLESTWLIKSGESANAIWARLARHIDKNDLLLIIEVRNNKHGWLPQDAWNWIDQNVPA